MRRFKLSLAAGAVSVAAACTVLLPAAAAAKPHLTVTKVSAAPLKVTGLGGSITIVARVTMGKTALTDVSAQALLPGGFGGSTVALTQRGKNTWQGSVSVPRNPRTKKVTGKIWIYAGTPSGQKQAVLTTFTEGPGDNSLPPPPPPQ